MRFRLIATYLGATYQAAVGPGYDEITLFAACPPPEELGFSSAAGHWRLLVGIADLDGLRQARPLGHYRDSPCLVLDDQGDRLHITYLGDNPEQARALGYWEIDREVFEMVVPRADVIGLTESQMTIPAHAVIISPAPAWLLAAPVEPPVPAAPLDEHAPPDQYAPADEYAPLDEYAPADEYPQPDQYAPADEYEPVVAHLPLDEHATAEGSPDGHQTLDRMAAWHGSPEPWPSHELNGHEYRNGNGSRRTARRERVPIQAIFAELADLAAIPKSTYALDDEVPGAMCLLKTEDGFEVFASSDDARHEVRFFEDEEAAYFYLFGVLAAESVRNGALLPAGLAYTTRLENISKYLRARISYK